MTTAEATSTETRPAFTHREILEIVAALVVCLFVASLSQTVVATALPTIVGELGGQDQLAWVASATLLATTVSTPLWGKLSDLLGRKPLMQTALVVFALTSAVAGFAQTMPQLIAARAGQGLGIGGIIALSQAIMGDIVSPRERGRYGGYLGASFAVATVAGPLIGGFLVDGPGWRWCFYVGIPVTVFALVILQRVLKLSFVRQKAQVKVDWAGASLVTLSASSLLLMLSLAGNEFAWASWWTVLFVVVSLAGLVLAIVVERRAPDPLLPPRLFRDRTFCLSGIASFFVAFAMFGAMIYLPLYLQIVRGKSPTVSGLLMVPMVLAISLMSIVSGKLITRWGRWKVFPAVGILLVGGASGLFSTLSVDTPLPLACTYMAILGAGLGCTLQVLILAVQNTTERRDLGIATSSSTFFRSMGGAVGVALFGAVLIDRVRTTVPNLLAQHGVSAPVGNLSAQLGTPAEIGGLPEPLRSVIREGFTLGLDRIYLIAVPIALLSFLALILMRETPLRRS